MNNISAVIYSLDNSEEVHIAVDNLVAMGFTARDTSNLEKLFEAFKKIGAIPPKRIPTAYPLASYILSADEVVDVVSDDTNGEVEYLLVFQKGQLFIGVGSDHADKKIEAISVEKSKQLCAKHMAKGLWKYEDVKEHWDSLILRSWYTVDGKESLYQDGGTNIMQPPQRIIEILSEIYKNLDNINLVVFSGSIPVLDGFKYGEKFRYEIVDPVLNRSIASSYTVRNISIEN